MREAIGSFVSIEFLLPPQSHFFYGKSVTNFFMFRKLQAIIWTNAGILLIWTLETNFSENLIEIYIFSFTKMHLKMLSGKLWPFCLGLNVLKLSE